VLLKLGRNPEAVEAVRKALAMKPLELTVRTWAHAVLGCALFRSGETEKGIEHLRRSTCHHFAIRCRSHVWLAEALAATGKVDEARSVLERRASDYPEDPDVWNALARFLVTTEGLGPDDRRAGLEHARRAVENSNRQGPVMLATLAEALFVNGRTTEAIAAAEEALQVMNGRDAAGLTLAEMNQRLEGYKARAGSAK
jgi:tetratricopeptide (TPR) repeat protein